MITAQIMYNFLTLLLLSIIVHELGHLFSAARGKPIIAFDFKRGLRLENAYGTPKETFGCLAIGIMAGTLPILIGGLFNEIYCLLLIPYFAGCTPDIKTIWRVLKNGNGTNHCGNKSDT